MLYLRPVMLGALLLTAHICEARQSADSLDVAAQAELPEVVVEASRTWSAGSPIRLDARGVQSIARSDVADWLRAAPSLSVRQWGESGAATVSMRGFSAVGTRVSLNGIRLVDPTTGVMDVSVIPAQALDHIDVESGAASGSALGGSVMLTTNQDPGWQAYSSAGSFAFREVGASVIQRSNRGHGAIHTQWRDLAGDFRYRDPIAPERPWRSRESADFQRISVLGTGSLELGSDKAQPITVSGMGLVASTNRGVPALTNARASAAHQDDRWFVLGGQASGTLRGVHSRISVSGSTLDLEYTDPNGVIHDGSSDQVTVAAGLRTALGRRTLVRLHAENQWSGARFSDGDQANPRHELRDTNGSMSIVHGVQRLSGSATVRIQHRAHTSLSDQSDLGASLRLDTQPLASRPFRAGIAWSRIHRLPTLNELFWQPGGNPSLLPESGHHGEVTLSTQATGSQAAVTVRAAAFMSRLDDMILWTPRFAGAGTQVWTPGNVARVDGHGVELDVRWSIHPASRPSASWSGSLSTAWTRQIDRSNPDAASWGHQLRYVAPWRLAASVRHEASRWEFSADWSGTHRRAITSDESRFLPFAHRLDLTSGATLGSRLRSARIWMSLRNATNHRTETHRFMPLPGRHVRFGITLISDNPSQNPSSSQ